MLVITGLGNPGLKYAHNRHNIGFMAVDAIVRRHNFGPWVKKFSGEICEGMFDGHKVLALKPLTFMNDSGRAVAAAMQFYKLELKDVVVIYDELDLVPGKVRVKTGGGSGGHNGIKSIDQHCGKDYRRIRLGIGHPGSPERVLTHVLGDFHKMDKDWVDPLMDALSEAAPLLLSPDENAFANRVAVLQGKNDEPSNKPAKPKAQSEIRAARPKEALKLPETGPMAAMLKRLFSKE